MRTFRSRRTPVRRPKPASSGRLLVQPRSSLGVELDCSGGVRPARPDDRGSGMGVKSWIGSGPLGAWPVVRQLTGEDPIGRGAAAESKRSLTLTPRTKTADRVAKSVCPYCAVGCGQKIYVKDEKIVQIEGDPDSPISRGRLCPKGSASLELVTGPQRQKKVL